MTKTITADAQSVTRESKAELKLGLQQMLARMAELDAQIERDQADIDRLKAETRAMLKPLTPMGIGRE